MDLDYDPRIPSELLRTVEREARRLGLPLRRIELLGQDRAVARTFVRAAEDGRGEAHLEAVDWERLERILRARVHARELMTFPDGAPDLPGILPVG